MTAPVPSSGLSAERVDEIEARANAARPGPWRWFGNMRHRGVYLATERGGRVFVMQFDRWGMGNAQPVFQVNQTMLRLPEMADMIECDHNGEIVRLAHPDAEFIAGSRQDVDDLLAEVRRLQGENARIAEERETYRRAWNRSDALLASAREATAQAVRDEREACATIADDVKARCEHWSMQEGYANAGIIADEIRPRSLPGETADA